MPKESYYYFFVAIYFCFGELGTCISHLSDYFSILQIFYLHYLEAFSFFDAKLVIFSEIYNRFG